MKHHDQQACHTGQAISMSKTSWPATALRLLVLALLVCACSSPTPPPAVPTVPTPAAPAAPPSKATPEPAPSGPSSAPPASRPRAPIPVRPINAQANCRFQDETGYNGNAMVSISNSNVNALKVNIYVPKNGQCNFDLQLLQQVRQTPAIELKGRDGKCSVHIWEQGARLTIAFTRCETLCTPARTFSQIWPVLIDRSNGTCR